MKLITRKSKAREFASRWVEQYGEDKNGLAARVKEVLGENPDPDALNELVGNTSWTDCRCSECRKWVEAFVEVRDGTAWLCAVCLIRAQQLINAGEA
jgi:hypothetical protein|tara:strand:+ start:401 stop:691 length:291 start_codon:yes stop_codon:yes gene_type:complete